MLFDMLGNAEAQRQVESYLECGEYGGLLFIGPRGVGKHTIAVEVAKKILDASTLVNHPDYLYIEIPADKKTIGVELIQAILNLSSLTPSIANRNVVVIDGFDSVTKVAQNKLLKTLEDSQGNIVIIGVAHSDNILPTIKSRMKCIRFREIKFDEFKKMDDSYIDYVAARGCCGYIERIKPHKKLFEDIARSIYSGRTRELFPLLHVLKEKDKDNFYSSNITVVQNLFYIMEESFLHVFMDKVKVDIPHKLCDECINSDAYSVDKIIDNIQILGKNRLECVDTVYTVDNFFICLKNIQV